MSDPNGTARTPGSGLDDRRWLIRLYVAGMTASASRALDNLNMIAEVHLGGEVDIEVVDILEQPAIAEEEGIFAVPTVIRHLPEPVRRVVGDLSDTDKALGGLSIRPRD